MMFRQIFCISVLSVYLCVSAWEVDNVYPFPPERILRRCFMTWHQGLETAKEVHDYMNSSHWFAREQVYNASDGVGFLGKLTQLSLFAFYEVVVNSNVRFGRSILLDFKGCWPLHSHIARNQLHTYVDYIFYHFNVAIGPMGISAQVVSIDQVADLMAKSPTMFPFSYGWSYEYPSEEDAPLGYKKSHKRDMLLALKRVVNPPGLAMIEIDAVHGSHTKSLAPFFHVSKFVLIRTLDYSKATARKVDVTIIRKMIYEIGIKRLYLDVSDDLRKEILKEEHNKYTDVNTTPAFVYHI